MWRDRGGSLDCMWAWKQYGGAHNHQTAKQSNLAEKGFFRSQLQRWNPKWCHFLFHSIFFLQNRKRQHFPACNWLICAVFPGRRFFGMQNTMYKPRMSSLRTLLANQCCFHRGGVWLVDKHNGANIAIILNVANFFHKVWAEILYIFITDSSRNHKTVKQPNNSEPLCQTVNFLHRLSAEKCIYIYHWLQQKSQNYKKPNLSPENCRLYMWGLKN